MIMIQDDPLPTGADKPLRITGDPQKVQVCYGGAFYTQFCPFLGAVFEIKISVPFYSKPVNLW